ncbi:MAG TPA: tail fiber protein [Nevskia sp.]|jgi:microcystin-dependent protein|nr:tail fiber protein [Nevskia sp.]
MKSLTPGTNWTGAYSRFSYNMALRYFAMLKEKGLPVLDDEFNVLQDMLLTLIRELVLDSFGSGSPNNGFLIVGTSAANNFTIKGGDGTVDGAGVMWAGGLRLILPSDTTYSGQEQPQGALAPPGGGTRIDTVYLDTYLDEYGPIQDATMVDPTLNVETSRRLRLQWIVKVAQGGAAPGNYVDANGLPHFVTTLATIDRTVSPNIDAGMVTDLRNQINVPTLVNSAVAAHNASLTAHYYATSAQRGFVQLALAADVSAGTSTTLVCTPASLQGTIVPSGTIFDYAGSATPTGFLFCDGSAVNRITYGNLFAALGTTFGAGDGVTTFNLPDLRRRVTMGSGGTGTATIGNARGNTGGEEGHILTTAELAAHSHLLANTDTVPDSGATFPPSTSLTNANQIAVNWSDSNITYQHYGLQGTNTPATIGLSASAGGGAAHNNIQPSLIVNKIIKY